MSDPEKSIEELKTGPISPSLSGDTFVDCGRLESQLSEPATLAEPCEKRPWFTLPRRFSRGESDPEVTDTTCRILEQCPNGYPRAAGFMSSDRSFMMYRGFSYLHSRVLLGIQDEIATLERQLDNLDKCDAANAPNEQCPRLKSRVKDEAVAKREGELKSRPQLLAEIRMKLLEYDELLVKTREVAAFQRPSERDYRSVRRWFANEWPLVPREQGFIKHHEDIVTLRNGREGAGFDGFVESSLQLLPRSIVRRFFLTHTLRQKTNDRHIHYLSPERVDVLVNMIITAVIFIMLVVPVVVMYYLTSIGSRNATFRAIGVLIIFTLLFSAAMSMLTRARRHELFAASAAYCAVLVVFIGNFGSLP